MLQTTPPFAREPSWPSQPVPRRPMVVAALANSGTRIDASHLQRYCFTSQDELLEDITSVIGAVRAADRSVVRQHTKGWARDLVVIVPVSNLKLWRSPEVT